MLALLSCGVVVGSGDRSPAPQAGGSDGGLDRLFEPGQIFQDRNGDGAIDFVNATVVLSPAATAGEVAAAAAVAARLGHETSSMNLPIGAGSAGTAIAVGLSSLQQLGLTTLLADVKALPAGEGIVTTGDAAGRPVVVVAGSDDAGTRAAADFFASRLPHAWDPGGPRIGEIAGRVRSFLSERGVSASSVEGSAAHVKSGSDALDRLVITARVATAAEAARARTALAALAPTAPGARAPAPAASKEPAPLADVAARAIRIRVASDAAPVVVDLPGSGPRPPAWMPRRPGGGARESLDLSSLFSNDGLLGDSDNNLIPDRTDVVISAAGDGAAGTVDLAARLGLESAGVTFPISLPPGAIEQPDEQPTLVLVGSSHPLVARLIEEKKMAPPDLAPGEGSIQIVKRAFGSRTAVVVTGGDAAGLARALTQISERLPHVWDRGKDRTTLGDIEDDVRRFLAGRSPEGQAAAAVYRLRALTADLAGRDLESVDVAVSVEHADEGLQAFVRDEIGRTVRADRVTVSVENRDVQKASPIVDEEIEIPSEVDEFWKVFRSQVIPAVRKGQAVTLEARLSEPPAIRTAIETQARSELAKAGAAAGTAVTVLSAYKQGFSWLYDVVRPALAGKTIDRLTIRFAELGPPEGWPHQALYAPTRWLMEIFPVDELLARDLKLDLNRIDFQKMPIGSPAYEAIATGPGGAEIYRQTFEPRWVLRPYLDQFANYEQVRVTTGWIRAEVGGKVAVDRRIVTDIERFWDHYQAKTLPALYEHVMKVHEGRPRADDAPFFGELTVDVSLSEPDYEVGVDKEQMMSMETLHEDLYFTTLSFFDVLGRFTRNADLQYPGRVIPIMRPRDDGRPGRAKIRVSGFNAPRPMVSVRVKPRGGAEERRRLDIPKVAVEMPAALSARVRAGREGIERLDLRVAVDMERDQRAELVKRSPERQVDARIFTAEQAAASVEILGRMRAAGLYRGALAYHDLGALQVAAGWTHDVDPAAQRVAALAPNGQPAPWPDITPLLPAGYRHTGGPIVQWDTPIPPPEAKELVAKLATFPEATAYKVGESYLGKDIWALDLMSPLEGTHWSQAKATTLKPTVVFTGRQHANEVSSTSHLLKLAELLLTDPEFKRKLQKVNVVVHPITNPDGAQLAYDLYKITPDYSLHAGYLGSLGVDATSGGEADPIYPEAKVRPRLWRTWLPDLFLNPHGYPHHMWIQPFSEFIGPVRNGRVTEERHWGIIRGWFMPGFGYLDDPRHPRHKAAAFRIRDKIYNYVKGVEDIAALNRRAYARYLRYGVAWDNTAFKSEDFTHDVLIYTALKGSRAGQGGGPGGGGGGGDYMTRYPNVTIWTGTTEAPDETAHGPWLHMVAMAGLRWDTACLDYLVEGQHRVDRRREAFVGGMSLSMSRARPPRDSPGAKGTTTSEGRP
jgi:hypothetical protein